MDLNRSFEIFLLIYVVFDMLKLILIVINILSVEIDKIWCIYMYCGYIDVG